MNYIKEIVKMFDVEIGEKFNVIMNDNNSTSYLSPYSFTEKNLLIKMAILPISLL